jgi:hypothetical protein
MQSAADRSLAPSVRALEESSLRVAFLGERAWLDGCAPPKPAGGLVPAAFELWPDGDHGAALDRLRAFRPHVTVVLDPGLLSAPEARDLPGIALGVLVEGLPQDREAGAPAAMDRIVSFDPALTGEPLGDTHVWRSIPPPVSDLYFSAVRPLHVAPLAMSIGESSNHREAMLLPAKHRFDLLEIVHGLSGAELVELLREYDVGVYVGAEHGGGFGPQVGIHLAAGQLLIGEPLRPAHGLEPNIDYLQVRSREEIVIALERLARFPEMCQSIRVRGRLKAEQYRASRLFSRLAYDLLADVSAFGPQ